MERLRAIWNKVTTLSYLRFLTWKVAIFAFVYANLWALFGPQALPPNGTYFHLWMIFIASYFSSKVAGLFNLPPLIGMLVAGWFY